jgi:ABC-2 type transport system ATP-binding protein
MFAIVGPNGSGKTTTLKILAGLLFPTSGSATLFGRRAADVEVKRRIGFMPEAPYFYDHLTGEELLHYYGSLFGLPRRAREQRVDELLGLVGMQERRAMPLRHYSRGMLQRIGLAQALLNDPRVVFLDEPTSGLDPLGRLLVRDIIREMKSQGTTVFLNSHMLGEVEATCDRVAFVKQGRTVGERTLGAAEAGLDLELKLGPISPAVLEGLGRLGSGLRQEAGTVWLRVSGEDQVPGLTRWLVGQGVDVYGLQARRRSLEAVFLEVMGDDQRPG